MTLELCETKRHTVARLFGKSLQAFAIVMLCTLAGVAAAGKDKPGVQYQIPLPAPPDYSALDWLVGEWTGTTTGNSPEGKVHLSVSLDIEKQFLILREEVSLAATPTTPAMKESWMGILCPDPGAAGFVLRVFSSTGFVTRYRVKVDGPQVRLNPDGGDRPPADWLFRRVLMRTAPGEFTETVQTAPPSKSFFDWYTARFMRVSPPAKPSPAPPSQEPK